MEMPVILDNRGLDPNRKSGKMEGEEEERHKWSLTPKSFI
jgi:hypothetical protein